MRAAGNGALLGGRVVASRLVLICIIAIVCFAGCKSNNVRSSRLEPNQSGVCTAVTDFLRGQNLPDLESVEAWQNEYGPGLKLTTAHYEILTTLLEPLMLRRIPGFVESTYRAYNSQLPEPVETPSTRSGAVPGLCAQASRAPARDLHGRFVVYLFADRAQWEAFTRSFAGEQAELFCRIQAGAYYHQNACVAYDIGPDRTFSVLGHEGWHQFDDRHFKFRLPSWLDEGVAMLFETQQTEDGAFHFEPADNRYRLEALKRTLDRDRMMPLAELIATTPGDVLATDQTEAVMAFYSQSYALVRFLREADSGKRLASYRRLLADGLHGDWPLDETSRKIAADRSVPRNILWNNIVGLILFQEYVGDDFEPVEQEYMAFCREITQQDDDK